jgi:putative hydrolase of the HAD superfamily
MILSGVCFDATGTLIETAENVGEVYRRLALDFGVDLPAWRIEDAFGRILRQAPARKCTGDSFEVRRRNEMEWWFDRIRETFQATDSTARFEDFPAFARVLFENYRSADAWRLRRGARPMLLEFRRRGMPLAIVSNFDHRLPEILEGLDISSFFEFLAIPSTVGKAKPHRAPFAAAARNMTLSSDSLDCLAYVGDDTRPTLRAIKQLGLTVLDVTKVEDLSGLPDRLTTTATLPASHTPN